VKAHYNGIFWGKKNVMFIGVVTTLTLGSRPRQRLAKVGAKSEAQESHFTFPSELSFWELKSQWTFKSSKGDYRGQNSLD
jgi:hypothetical protein